MVPFVSENIRQFICFGVHPDWFGASRLSTNLTSDHTLSLCGPHVQALGKLSDNCPHFIVSCHQEFLREVFASKKGHCLFRRTWKPEGENFHPSKLVPTFAAFANYEIYGSILSCCNNAFILTFRKRCETKEKESDCQCLCCEKLGIILTWQSKYSKTKSF